MQAKAIEHYGFIEEINTNGIRVRFISQSACASCHAKGACSASDMEDKEVIISGQNMDFRKGEHVRIIMNMNQGNRAVLLGYVYPLILFVLMLLILNSLNYNEIKSGLYSLAVLVPYYLILLIFKDRINKKFSFSIKKYE